jgi:N-methylhydantoinase A
MTMARRQLRFGAIADPAILSQLDATTLVLPGWTGEVHASGAILLRYDPDGPTERRAP